MLMVEPSGCGTSTPSTRNRRAGTAALSVRLDFREHHHPVVVVVGVFTDTEDRPDSGREPDRADDPGEEIVGVTLVQMGETQDRASVVLGEECEPADRALYLGLAVRVDGFAEM